MRGAMQAAIGKRIKALSHDDDALHFEMEDGSRFALVDQQQSCCEQRYMSTDDDLSYYVGAELRGAEVRDGPTETETDEFNNVHEQQFLVVQTSEGDFTMVSHNEHNGYYGGFDVEAVPE